MMTIVSLGLIILNWSAVQAQDDQGARLAIEESYQQRYAAAKVRDLYGMRYGRADDFKSYDLEGKVTDIEAIQRNWKSFLPSILKAHWEGKILRFGEIEGGEKVNIVVAERFEAIVRNEQQTAVAHMITESALMDVWELREGRWIQVSSQVVKHKQVRSDWEPVAKGNARRNK
jgi:hypothetical protein